ncbi:MAG TPA: DNRLRE domain-containing protein [Anaerolineae bacterium]|nr:DNRLRE domain-containing protein [Anaerolineae bacterium]
MRRNLLFILFSGVILLLLAGAVYAAATNPEDSYVEVIGNQTAIHGSETDLTASATLNIVTNACDSNYIVYLKWDLDQVNGEASVSGANKTNLTLNVNLAFQVGSDTLNLYKVADDSWTESTINGANAPALGDLIMQISAPTTTGPVVFESAALADWINENSSYTGGGDTISGDDTVSFAIQVEGCSDTTLIQFDSKETTSGTPPALNIFDPTAVSLASFSATDVNPVNWSLIVGLFALGAAVLVGVGYGMRRSRRQS